MRELKEIAKVISRHKIKQIEVIGNQNQGESLFNQFYDLVQSNEINSDEQAMFLLYPHQENSKSKYARLKSRFKHRLLNTLFFIDINQPQFSDIQKAFFTCNKNWLAARTLISRGANRSAIKLIESTLTKATQYEFTELIVFLTKQLIWHYSIISGNEKKYRHYNEQLKSSLHDLHAETVAEQYYTEVMLNFSRSQASNKDSTLDNIISLSNSLLTEYPNTKSFRFIRISYLLHITRYQIEGKFESAIDICNQAILEFKNKPYESKGAQFTFSLRLLICYIQIKQFDKGQDVAEQFTSTLPSGSYDWYIMTFYHFLLCTHSGKYQKAYDIVRTSLGHKNFQSIYPALKQLWLVNNAYIFLLVDIGLIQKKSDENQFRLYKFLNDIPIYSKDKRGVNISILIVHVLFLLQQKKYSEIIDRVDSLNQYCHRYLKKDDTFRSNCFIKMLLQMARADFNRIRTERYAEKYVDKLESTPIDIASQNAEVEIIPYEQLWTFALDLLDSK